MKRKTGASSSTSSSSNKTRRRAGDVETNGHSEATCLQAFTHAAMTDEFYFCKEENKELALCFFSLMDAEFVRDMAANHPSTWPHTLKPCNYGFATLDEGDGPCVYTHTFTFTLEELPEKLALLKEQYPNHKWFPLQAKALKKRAKAVRKAGGSEVDLVYVGEIKSEDSSAKVRLVNGHLHSAKKSSAMFHHAIKTHGMPHKSYVVLTRRQILWAVNKIGATVEQGTGVVESIFCAAFLSNVAFGGLNVAPGGRMSGEKKYKKIDRLLAPQVGGLTVEDKMNVYRGLLAVVVFAQDPELLHWFKLRYPETFHKETVYTVYRDIKSAAGM
jgi:hypothetical protein